jgi:O-methyltransferase involved in polyketide biosynthesis
VKPATIGAGMPAEKVRFTEDQSTNLATLYGRALDARTPDPILNDRTAEEAISRIDYDFAKFKMNNDMAVSIASRAKAIDDEAADFLAGHPDATVVHLGCGMDTRVFRLDPPPTVRWFDVDFPDVIALRERIYPGRPGYTMLGSSVTDLGWLSKVPADKPALVVAEGLTMYLDPAAGEAMLRALVEHFPGGEMVFDTQSRLAIRLQKLNAVVRRAGATLRWGIDDPREFSELGLEVVTSLTAADFVRPDMMHKYSWAVRWQMELLRLPAMRRMAHVVRLRF